MAFNYQVNCTDAPPAALPRLAPRLHPFLYWRPYTCATDYSHSLLYTLRAMPSMIGVDLIMVKRRVLVALRAVADSARVQALQAPGFAVLYCMTVIVGASGNVWACWPGICADVHTHTPVLVVSVLTKIIMYAGNGPIPAVMGLAMFEAV
jgi:hypothetical protein